MTRSLGDFCGWRRGGTCRKRTSQIKRSYFFLNGGSIWEWCQIKNPKCIELPFFASLKVHVFKKVMSQISLKKLQSANGGIYQVIYYNWKSRMYQTSDYCPSKAQKNHVWTWRQLKGNCIKSLYWQNFSQTCYLVNLATICKEMQNASKNLLTLKGAPYMVNLIAT